MLRRFAQGLGQPGERVPCAERPSVIVPGGSLFGTLHALLYIPVIRSEERFTSNVPPGTDELRIRALENYDSSD